MPEPAYAPASVRNRGAILGVLADEFRHCRHVLEIGTGDAVHAVTFARELPHLVWHSSDLDARIDGIRDCIAAAGVANLETPIPIDVRTAELPAKSFDAVYSCNTAHIMDRPAVSDMLRLAADVLVDCGLFCCYGPFRREGRFSTPSNAAFDASLRARDPAMGIRDLDDVDASAMQVGLVLQRRFAMPANNLFLVWARQERKR